MLDRAYIEITNVCNLSCSFCPGSGRKKGFVSLEDYRLFADCISRHTDCLYLHVMGEPTLHPRLSEILEYNQQSGLRTVLTTNGTLLAEKGDQLLASESLYKVQISLHSLEANRPEEPPDSLEERERVYFRNCFDFALSAGQKGIIVILRLWNEDGREKGENRRNDRILALLREAFPAPWAENKRGYRLLPKVYLEYDRRFVWPSEGGRILRQGGRCQALSRQIAVLWDGTVVPCCLDGQGKMALGNLKKETLEQILSSELAERMRRNFISSGPYIHPFCRTCSFADRFDRSRNLFDGHF